MEYGIDITLEDAIDWANGDPNAVSPEALSSISGEALDGQVISMLDAACRELTGAYDLSEGAVRLGIPIASMRVLLRLIDEGIWLTGWEIAEPYRFTINPTSLKERALPPPLRRASRPRVSPEAVLGLDFHRPERLTF